MEPIKPVQRSPRPRRRVRTPKPEIRARLLKAAGELIEEEDFASLRVEEIAAKASLSVGTFYLYFEGKPDLFANLVMEMTAGLRAKLQAAYQSGGSVAERFERAIEAYLDFVDSNRKGFLYFRDAGTVHTTVGPIQSWAFEQHAEDLAPLLEEAMDLGEVRREDSRLLAQALLGQMQHLAGYWLEHEDRFTRDELKAFLLRQGARGTAP